MRAGLLEPVAGLVRVALGGGRAAEADEDQDGLADAEPVRGTGFQGALVVHARVVPVPGEPGRVAETASGGRHLVRGARRAGQVGGTPEVRHRLLGVAAVQQHGGPGPQQVGGLLGCVQFPDVLQALVEQFEGAVVLAAPARETAQRIEAVGHAPAVTGRTESGQRAREGRLGGRRIALELRLVGESQIQQRAAPGSVADLDGEQVVVHGVQRAARQRPQDHRERQPQRPVQGVHERGHARDAAGFAGVVAAAGDGVHQAQGVLLGEARGRGVAQRRQQGVGQRHALAVRGAQPPEPGQGRHEPQGVLGSRRDEMAQGRVQVVPLGVQAGQPGELAAAAQSRFRPLGQLAEVRGVGVPQRPNPVAPLGGERADRLQHPVAALGHLQEATSPPARPAGPPDTGSRTPPRPPPGRRRPGRPSAGARAPAPRRPAGPSSTPRRPAGCGAGAPWSGRRG